MLLALACAACSSGGDDGGSGIGVASLPSGPGDDDGDSLSNSTEVDGWEIAVDASGLGGDTGPQLIHVTSSPTLADTDGDGLDDGLEFQIRSNPRLADTDGDGLSDAAEWTRWKTSPASADSDGDARGPAGNLPPRSELFDGNEVNLLHTSPTLADTDGDGATDYEEFASGEGHPLIAELPRFELEFAGELDVRLDVEYEESNGTSTEYGTSFGTEQSRTTSSSASHTFSTGVEIATMVGIDAGVPPKASASVTTTVSVGYEGTLTSGEEDSRSSQIEHSRYQSESRDRTETAASGRISTGVRLRNGGSSTFTIEGLATTVLYAPQGTEHQFSTMATLEMPVGAVTLAPGEESPVLLFEASGVNTDIVKSFLALPDALVLQPGVFNLLDVNGIDFEFLTQTSYQRTATIQIYLGKDENDEDVFEVYRVATQTGRDASGNFTGITLGEALQVAGLAADDPISGYVVIDQTDDSGAPTGQRVFQSIRGRDFVYENGEIKAFWGQMGSRDEHEAATDVEQIPLIAGDLITLAFTEDRDLDGLYKYEEDARGTLDSEPDSDFDGISDYTEVRGGWEAGYTEDGSLSLYDYPREVTSDPRTADTDDDGLDDFEERALGTDPQHPDTDRDGLLDGVDLNPKVQAQVLRVDSTPNSSSSETSWPDAMDSLQEALVLAAQNNLDGDPANDVSQIWVARGSYSPPRGGSFEMVDQVSVYGGFEGLLDEVKLEQRNADPLFGGAILEGDLDGNDPPSGNLTDRDSDDLDAHMEDNSIALVTAAPGVRYRLDGFTLQGSASHCVSSSPGAYSRLSNLLIRRNLGSLLIMGESAEPSKLSSTERSEVSDCLFIENQPRMDEGVAWVTDTDVRDCEFAFNLGDGLEVQHSLVERTRFEWNEGFGAQLRPHDLPPTNSTTFIGCEWRQNGSASEPVGGLVAGGGSIVAVNCLFHRNVGSFAGAFSNGIGPSWLINCTIVGNISTAEIPAYWVPVPGGEGSGIYRTSDVNQISPAALSAGGVLAYDAVWMDNCILYGNTRILHLLNPVFGPFLQVPDELAQISSGYGLMHSTLVEKLALLHP
jgi:hypothetical protein